MTLADEIKDIVKNQEAVHKHGFDMDRDGVIEMITAQGIYDIALMLARQNELLVEQNEYLGTIARTVREQL